MATPNFFTERFVARDFTQGPGEPQIDVPFKVFIKISNEGRTPEFKNISQAGERFNMRASLVPYANKILFPYGAFRVTGKDNVNNMLSIYCIIIAPYKPNAITLLQFLRNKDLVAQYGAQLVEGGFNLITEVHDIRLGRC